MLLTELKIGEPARQALKVIGVSQLEELTQYTSKELLQLHGFGPKALRILEEELTKQELKLME